MRRQIWLPLAAVLAVCWAVHLPLLRAPFLADDEALVLAARERARESRLIDYFSPRYWQQEHAGTKGLYRPLREIVFGTVTLRWGLRPFFFHLLNLTLHSFNIVFLFLLVRRILSDDRVALGSAFLFALHPAHVEALGFAKNFAELLSAAGGLAALLAFLAYLGTPGARRRRVFYYSVSVACLAFGLLAKEASVTVPPLLAVMVLGGASNRSLRESDTVVPCSHSAGQGKRPSAQVQGLTATLPHWLLAGLYALFLTNAGMDAGALVHRDTAQPLVALGTAAFYTRFLFLPLPLTASHGLSFAPRVLSPLTAAQVALVALAALGLVLLALRWRKGMLFALWPPLALLPFLNLVPTTGRLVGEQRLYWPSVGMCVLLGFAFTRTAPSVPRSRCRLLATAFALLVFCFGGLCFWRSDLMGTKLRFERYEVRHAPEEPAALYKLGKAYSDAGYLRSAIRHLESAVATARRAPVRAGILSELGTAYGRAGRDDLAVPALKQSLEAWPNLVGTRESLGTALLRLGRPKEAVKYLQEAIERDPSRPGPLVNLGQAYIELGDLDKADRLLGRARRRFPNDAVAHVAGGVLASRRNNWSAAIEHLERAAALDPSRATTWQRLAVAYRAVSRLEDAARAMENARRLSHGPLILGQQ